MMNLTTAQKRALIILVVWLAFMLLACDFSTLDNDYGYSDAASRAILQILGQ